MPEGKISDVAFEAANIVLYTKDKAFFANNKGAIKKAVQTFKKRIELRADPEVLMAEEKAEAELRKIIPEDAGVSEVIFEKERSQVTIEAEKPGLAIGKQGALLKEIRKKTLWVPIIKRTPPIRSILIENIRKVLYQNSDYRRKFLDKVGHRIYDGWKRAKTKEWIRLTQLGGGRQVGRSCQFLQTPESRILLDCGINVATDEPGDAYPHLDVPEFKINELDAVIITHSHLDHCGFVPYLFKYGYRGPVYITSPTRDVMSLLMLDLVKLMNAENKTPLYEVDDVKEMLKHTITLNFEEVADITPDIRLTFYNAGHILGSAMAHLHIGNGLHNYMYTGDMKFGKSALLAPAVTNFPRLESMTMEATYGGRTNILPPHKEQDEYLQNIIRSTIGRGGKILMPVLGSGRAQDMIVMIEAMVRKGDIPEIPVYIDGMVWDITAIHTAYPEFLNSTIHKLIFHKDQNPFLSPIFRKVGSSKERMQVIENTGPCIVLATSGMMVGGPSVEYLKHFADNPKNSLVFSCYQPAGALGHRIREGLREYAYVDRGKQYVVPIKLEVHKLEITDHSDRKQLMNFVNKCSPRPRKVILNHGEQSRCLDLASSIHKQYHIETLAPKNMETIRLR